MCVVSNHKFTNTNSLLLPVCHSFESAGGGVPGKQPEPRLEAAEIAQYFNFQNTLLPCYTIFQNFLSFLSIAGPK